MIDPAYFLIPTVELRQAHVSLSVNPFAAKADIPTRTISNVPYVILEVPFDHISHESFVNYRPYRLHDAKNTPVVDNLIGSRADLVGIFNISQTAQGPQDYTYTFAAERMIKALIVDIITFDRGDKISLAVQMPDGQGGWITANTPVTGWYVQTGRKDIAIPSRNIPAGFRIKLTLDRINTGLSGPTALTINLEQYKVGA